MSKTSMKQCATEIFAANEDNDEQCDAHMGKCNAFCHWCGTRRCYMQEDHAEDFLLCCCINCKRLQVQNGPPGVYVMRHAWELPDQPWWWRRPNIDDYPGTWRVPPASTPPPQVQALFRRHLAQWRSELRRLARLPPGSLSDIDANILAFNLESEEIDPDAMSSGSELSHHAMEASDEDVIVGTAAG